LIKKSNRIRIICPFISKNRAEWLVKFCSDERKIEVITEITKRGIVTGVQLPSTLKVLVDGGVNVSFIGGNLHSKIFWFDDEKIMITSANLTSNGLENNFEVGVLFDRLRGPFLAKDIDYFKIQKRISNLWTDLKRKETPLNLQNLAELLKVENETQEVRKVVLSQSYGDIGIKFNPYLKECANLSQVDIDLEAGDLFKGFKKEDWSAFDHGFKEVTKENVDKLKQILTEKIQPILQRFYENFQFARDLPVKLEEFDKGYSRNRWVKNFFPDYRYLWLVRKRDNKNPVQHISEPSFIIGMGKHQSRGYWFEIRMGVEELNEPRLTNFGRNFLINMKNDISKVVEELHRLGDGWMITHENNIHESFSEVSTKAVTKEMLSSMLDKHLSDEKIADLHIRRQYYMSDPKDLEILTTPKIITSIAADMKSLLYFFELAHRN
jgi:hypothetical protein